VLVSQRKTLPTGVFFLYIIILFFAPLAFGTVELWSLAAVESSVGILVLLILWYQNKGVLEPVRVPGSLPLLLLICWMLIQIIPLPPWLVRTVSPGSYAVYQPVLQAMEENIWIPVSVNIKATVSEAIRIGSYALFYIATVQLSTNRNRLQKNIKIVVGLAVFIAFLAIIQRYSSPDHIYWFRPGPENSGRLMGPWINRNQFAGFMVMLLPLLLGLFLYYRPSADKKESFRTRFVDALSSPAGNFQLVLAFGIILVLFAILLSLSRAGILISMISFLLFYYILLRKKNVRSWPLIVVFMVGVILFFLNFGGEEMASRIDHSFTSEGRLSFNRIDTWSDTLEIVKTFWLTGAGFGTFVYIFPVFKTIPGNVIFDHAHNDYLELLTEGGIIGFSLAAWFVVSVVKHGWTMIGRRRDRYSILIGIGSLVGICSMLLFSITDFNMHNGADGLYFFFLCGVLISSVNTRFKYRHFGTLLGTMPRKSIGMVLVSSILLLSATFVFPVRSFWAQRKYSEVDDVYLSRQLSAEKLNEVAGRVKKLSILDPLEGTYLIVLGDIKKYLGDIRAAQEYYLLAARKNPLRGLFLQKAALMLPKDRMDLAIEMMELSYKRDLNRDAMLLSYLEWLLWRGDAEQAGSVLQEGLTFNPGIIDDAIILLNAHFSQDDVAKILPPDVDAWIKYGHFVEKMGDIEQSEFFRKHALDYVGNEEEVKSWWYSQLISFYRKRKKEDEAIEVLRQAVSRIPEDPRFHIYLGDYYKKEGIVYRAREEYELALIFDPGNEGVLRRLENLDK